jgi:hypothetical protein
MSGDVHVRICERLGVRLPPGDSTPGGFNLELADEKRRLLLFGRFAVTTKAEYGERPDRFDFLGFSVLQKRTDKEFIMN